ncbi:MAG TPA: hypothetical protein VEM95_03560, partial [Thermoplasmata archaeon]|nr:hypothetical protein [Thermoplasmata archaeon]
MPEEANNLLGKIAPEIQDAAFKPEAGVYADVVFHTMDVPALGAALEAAGARSIAVVDGQLRVSKYVARPWGAVGVSETIHVQVLQSALLGLAAQPFVQYIDPVLMKSAFDAANPSLSEEQTAFQAYKDRVRAGVKNPIHPMGTSSSVSPTSWGIAREHKAWDVWNLNVGGQNIEGQGVNVAVIDTGEDFGNPSLANRWAVAPAGSPWAGWPIMFHPASMEGLMSDLFWTQDDDMARTPLPFWLSVNDGDTWYTNMDFTTNDTNLDGYLAFRDNSVNPLSGNLERTARENPQQYGNYLPTFNNRINRDYWVGLPTDASPPHIISKSGFYRIGLSRDDTLTGLWGKKVGMLLVDSTTPFVYDTVYVDLNFNLDFTDDKPVTKASPLAVADLNGDGIQDISG